MKKIYTSLFFILFAFAGFAQDTLFTIDGKKINAKVIEVGRTEVKYRNSNDSEKYYSTIALSEVTKIHYENGTSDVFLSSKTIDSNHSIEADTEYAKKRRNEAITDGLIVGVRVVGFILRVAFEIALAATGDCHAHSSSSHHGSGHHSGSNHPRGH